MLPFDLFHASSAARFAPSFLDRFCLRRHHGVQSTSLSRAPTAARRLGSSCTSTSRRLTRHGQRHTLSYVLVFLDLDTIEVRDPGPIYNEQITPSKIHVHPMGSSPLCSACENFANDAVSYLSNRQTQDKIVEILHDACSQTFSLEQKCVELMDSYATLLFTKITEIKPEEFCKQYGLCRDVALSSGVRSDSTCVFCRHLLVEVMSKLKDPDAEFEIIQILIKECNNIEGHVQQCKRLVLQYIPLILVNGEKFLEKNDICALVKACDASPKRTVSSSLEGGLLSDA